MNEKPTIVIDTREQTPLSFSENAETVRATLHTGDYSVIGAEDWLCIERKSLADLVGTLATAYEADYEKPPKRFNRELERMAEIQRKGGFVAVWICAKPSSLWAHAYRSRIAPACIYGLMQSASLRYGIQFLWMDSATRAATELENLARHAVKKIERTQNAKKSPSDDPEGRSGQSMPKTVQTS